MLVIGVRKYTVPYFFRRRGVFLSGAHDVGCERVTGVSPPVVNGWHKNIINGQ